MNITTIGLWNSLLAFCKDEEHLHEEIMEVYKTMQYASVEAQRSEEFPVWVEGDSVTAEEYSAKAEAVLAEYGWDAEAEALALRLLRPKEQFDAQDISYGEWEWSGNEPDILGLS
jgi:hypothetical protein